MRIGYTMMCEQAGPRQLVRDVVRAEEAGFDFAVISDHYFPWLEAQGHSPYAWSVLGAAAQATERIPLMTYVTCPTVRYHPAIVAQKAATVALLSEGRFTPRARRRREPQRARRRRAAGRRRTSGTRCSPRPSRSSARCSTAATSTTTATHFDVDSAKLWDLPDAAGADRRRRVRRRSRATLAGGLADLMIAIEPEPELGESSTPPAARASRGSASSPVCYGPDRDAAVARAHEQFRWFGGGWKVNAELPGPAAFEAATQFVTPGGRGRRRSRAAPTWSAVVEAVRPFVDAGFTDVALVQIGGDQQDAFLDWAPKELLPALQEL